MTPFVFASLILACAVVMPSGSNGQEAQNRNSNFLGGIFSGSSRDDHHIRHGFNFIPAGNRDNGNDGRFGSNSNNNIFSNNNNNNNLENPQPWGTIYEEQPTPVPEVEEPEPEKVDVSNVNSILSQRCEQRKSRDVRPDPLDCSKFSVCAGGRLLNMDCPRDSVFHELSGSCVPRGSYYDTCSRRQETQLTCPPGATYKKAHPKECAQFYHCGHPAQSQHWEEHLHECAYPMLYNDRTNRCEHYSMVLCGARREPMDQCEYKVNTCESAHCIPCHVRHPTCKGHQDGMNAWKGREGSPHYVVCANQRVVFNGMCAQTRGVQVFDQHNRVCRYM